MSVYSRLKKTGLAGAILSLALIVPLLVEAEESGDPWKFLNGFTPVRGAISQVEERYIAALFQNPKKALRPLVIYPADCGSQICSLDRPVAYSVFDTKGLIVKLYIEPGAELRLYRVLTSAVTGFNAA